VSLVLGVVVAHGLERAPVVLEQPEQLAVRQYPRDQGREALAPFLDGGPALKQFQRQVLHAGERLHERAQDRLFAGEVVVERGFGDADLLRDLAQRRLVVALLGEQVEGHFEDPITSVVHAIPILLDNR